VIKTLRDERDNYVEFQAVDRELTARVVQQKEVKLGKN